MRETQKQKNKMGIRIRWHKRSEVDSNRRYNPKNRLSNTDKKRRKINDYVPTIEHKNIHRIHQHLTQEERNYWWKLNHNLTSIKQREDKCKRDECGNLTSVMCPKCKTTKETRVHYNYDYKDLTNFRKIVAKIAGRDDFTREQ